jgi:hypothetical protein
MGEKGKIFPAPHAGSGSKDSSSCVFEVIF